jgi:hypothetical protein
MASGATGKRSAFEMSPDISIDNAGLVVRRSVYRLSIVIMFVHVHMVR